MRSKRVREAHRDQLRNPIVAPKAHLEMPRSVLPAQVPYHGSFADIVLQAETEVQQTLFADFQLSQSDPYPGLGNDAEEVQQRMKSALDTQATYETKRDIYNAYTHKQLAYATHALGKRVGVATDSRDELMRNTSRYNKSNLTNKLVDEMGATDVESVRAAIATPSPKKRD